MVNSKAKDLKVLGQIRERRLSRAEQEKATKIAELHQTEQQLEQAKKEHADAIAQAKTKIEAIYAGLLNGESHKVGSVDKARLAEALIYEHIAALAKNIADAEAEVQTAQENLNKASEIVIKFNAESEAIGLLNEEQAKLAKIAEQRVADEEIDEFAEQMTQRKKR